MSAERDTGGPAFPRHGSMGKIAHEGMTLRDYFMAHAPITMGDAMFLLAQDGIDNAPFGKIMDRLAIMRSCYAEAMLKARIK